MKCGFHWIILMEDIQTKQCTKCLHTKSLIDFPKNSKGKYGRGQVCKKCSAEYADKYRQENYNKVYAKKFNISEEEVQTLLEKHSCEICGKAPKAVKRNSIDHCHITGKVRGLLCDDCNTALGKFKDNPTIIQSAIDYLKKHAH